MCNLLNVGGESRRRDPEAALRLPSQWSWSAKHRKEWCSLTARPGLLRLYPQVAHPSFDDQPNLLLRKAPAHGFVVETLLDFFPGQWGEEAGLVLTGRTQIALALRHDGQRNTVVLRFNNKLRTIGPVSGHTVKLRMQMNREGMCYFEVRTSERLLSISDCFRATKSAGAGVKIGLYAIKQLEYSWSGHADFAGFQFL